MHGGPSWHVVKDGLLYPGKAREFIAPRPKEKVFWQLRYFYGDPSVEEGLQQKDIFTMIHHGEIPSQ